MGINRSGATKVAKIVNTEYVINLYSTSVLLGDVTANRLRTGFISVIAAASAVVIAKIR